MTTPSNESSTTAQSKFPKDRGSALVSVLMMSLVLFAFIIAISILVNQRFHSINLRQAQNRAKYAAQAGLTRSLNELSNNAFWNTGFVQQPLTADPNLKYTVEVFNNFGGSQGSPGAYAPDGVTWVPEDTVWIRSVGISGDVTRGSTGLIGVLGPFRPSFDHALFGDRSVRVSGTSVVESSPTVNRADVGSNALGETNPPGADPPAIVIESNSTVRGRAICGPTADPNSNSVIRVVSSVVGGREAANESKVLVPLVHDSTNLPPNTDLTIGAGAGYNLYPGGYNDITLNGGGVGAEATLTLTSDPNPNTPRGVYFIRGDLNLTNTVVRVEHADPDNPAVIYVGGDANFSGAATIIGIDENGAPIDPRALQVYFTQLNGSSTFQVTDCPNGNFVAAGDDLQITISNSTVNGAFIGRDIELISSNLTYQENLNSVPLDGRGQVTILSTDTVPTNVAQTIAEENPPPPAPIAPPIPPAPNPPVAPPPAQPGVAAAGSNNVVAGLAAGAANNAALNPNTAPPAPPTTTTNPANPSTNPANPNTNPVPTNNPVPTSVNPTVTTGANPLPTTNTVLNTNPIPTGVVTNGNVVNGPPSLNSNPAPSLTTTGPNGTGGTVIAPAPITIGPIGPLAPIGPILPSIQNPVG